MNLPGSERLRSTTAGASVRSRKSGEDELRNHGGSVWHESRQGARPERSGCEIRHSGRCQRARAATHSTGVAVPPPASPPAARVRSRVRVVQGSREPAPSPDDGRLVSLRRARDLVERRSRKRTGGAAAAAALRRRTNDRGPRQRGGDPVTAPRRGRRFRREAFSGQPCAAGEPVAPHALRRVAQDPTIPREGLR